MAWLATFEAKEIQRYILQGDKLRELVGGSTLINRLVENFLPTTLRELGLEATLISAAAGWARLRFEDKRQAETFVRSWPLLVQHYAPGLQVVQSLIEITGSLPEALRQAGKALRARRNLLACELPETTPLIERNPRTGLPAVGRVRGGDRSDFLDARARRKRCYTEIDDLGQKLAGSEAAACSWPLDIDHVAGGEQSFVAVIHADGNDLGSVLIRIGDHLNKRNDDRDAVRIYQALTKTIEETTVQAARAAFGASVLPDVRANGHAFFPLRPVVLGGDDLTVIIRADLAFAFTETFLEAFERISAQQIAANLAPFGIESLPEKLSACAGITFVKRNYPFAQAYELAESLCFYTKERAKALRSGPHEPVQSSFMFHRITTSLQQDFGVIRERELTSRGSDPISLSFGPYATGTETGKLPLAADLRKFSCALYSLPSGTVRTLIGTLYLDRAQAENDWRRLKEVAPPEKVRNLESTLARLTGNRHPWSSDRRTPLYEAHIYQQFAGTSGDAEPSIKGGAA